MANKPIKRYNLVVSVRKYIDADGNEKNAYKRIGEMMVWENGGISLELYHMPGIRISAFEQTDRQAQPPRDPFQETSPSKEELPTVPKEEIPVIEQEGELPPEEGSQTGGATGEVKNIPF